jgi:bifunctional UDP-N-acetylglucosamine pyrophosphorylase/glucosamine-1-phosphate N-acetyltransferase
LSKGKYMIARDTCGIILAAGLGTRMKSFKNKSLHELMGKPLLFYPVKLLLDSGAQSIIIVIGYQKEECIEAIERYFPEESRIIFAVQEKQIGTADAVISAGNYSEGFRNVLILNGDLPLFSASTVSGLVSAFKKSGEKIALVTSHIPDPAGYGRIVRNSKGFVEKIIEEKDADPEIKKIAEINVGMYAFERKLIYDFLKNITCDNIQKEMYLTDVVSAAFRNRHIIGTYKLESMEEMMQINDKKQLSDVSFEMRKKINENLMRDGVIMLDPATAYIEDGCMIGKDTVIEPAVTIRKETKIGTCCRIGQGSVINASEIGDNVNIKPYCVINECMIKEGAELGPFSHLRPQSIMEKKSKVGNFVELKKSCIGEGSKANHLSYIGDAVIGKNVNVGAGTITCNYDGKRKYQTIIEDEVFIGSDTQFVAPVVVHKKSYIGAGTTVTEDVPQGCLAISRIPQKNIQGYSEKKKKKIE